MRLRCAALLCAAASLAGCAADGSRSGSGTPNSESVAERREWPFWPTGMRVHPASRLVVEQETGNAFIEARIEFTDSLDDTSKAVGVMTFDLLVTSLPADVSNPVLSWELPLNTLDENALHYDGVTRTYLFRLSLGEWSTAPDVTLIAAFDSVDGKRFSASQRFQ